MNITAGIISCMKKELAWIQKTAFLTAAFLMAVIPALHTNLKAGQTSVMDNRVLEEFPFGTWRKEPEQIGSYLNDRIGFREQMITACQKLDLVLFGKLNHPIYQMGKNGWIYTREWDSADYQHLDVDERYVDAFADFLFYIQTYCQERNADFCFFLAPNKESIYPENYPDGYGIKNQPNRSDKIMDALNARGVNHIDSRTKLLQEKENMLVCNVKSDAGHWNMHGAFAGTQLLYEDFLLTEYPEIGMLQKQSLI